MHDVVTHYVCIYVCCMYHITMCIIGIGQNWYIFDSTLMTSITMCSTQTFAQPAQFWYVH